MTKFAFNPHVEHMEHESMDERDIHKALHEGGYGGMKVLSSRYTGHNYVGHDARTYHQHDVTFGRTGDEMFDDPKDYPMKGKVYLARSKKSGKWEADF